MKSETGFPLSSVIRFSSLVVITIFLIVFFKNLISGYTRDESLTIPLMVCGVALILGLIFSTIFPNSLNIELLKDSIKVSSHNKSTIIPLSKIKSIEASTNHKAIGVNQVQYYKIVLKEKSIFGQSIYYKSFPEYSEKFTHTLKYAWLKQNAH